MTSDIAKRDGALLELPLGTQLRGPSVGLADRSILTLVACIDCGKRRWVRSRYVGKSCFRCRHCGRHVSRQTIAHGFNHWNWQGGKTLHPEGYVLVRLEPTDFFYPMAHARGYTMEHRLIMAQHLGRCLWDWEVVHHINGDRADNRIENLELLTHGEHTRLHNILGDKER